MRLSPLTIQRAISAVFLVLGGWALVHPWSVATLCLRPEYRGGPALAFVIGAFGVQALIAGLFAATARFTAATFAGYGVMLVGFLSFNVWFGLVDPVLTPLGAGLDAFGNLAMLALCVTGYRSLAAR